jgi:hypothetical protein
MTPFAVIQEVFSLDTLIFVYLINISEQISIELWRCPVGLGRGMGNF